MECCSMYSLSRSKNWNLHQIIKLFHHHISELSYGLTRSFLNNKRQKLNNDDRIFNLILRVKRSILRVWWNYAEIKLILWLNKFFWKKTITTEISNVKSNIARLFFEFKSLSNSYVVSFVKNNRYPSYTSFCTMWRNLAD